MKSDHIDNGKLGDVVTEGAILDEVELEHLSDCEQCMELIRLLIRKKLMRAASP